MAYFDCILCGDNVEKPKPSGEILARILDRFSLAPEEALYVGDMAIDVQAGRDAQVPTLAVSTGSSTREELEAEKPFRVSDSIKEVLDVLEETGAKTC